jgi:hypothetical protein
MMLHLTQCSAEVISIDSPWGVVTGKRVPYGWYDSQSQGK